MQAFLIKATAIHKRTLAAVNSSQIFSGSFCIMEIPLPLTTVNLFTLASSDENHQPHAFSTETENGLPQYLVQSYIDSPPKKIRATRLCCEKAKTLSTCESKNYLHQMFINHPSRIIKILFYW